MFSWLKKWLLNWRGEAPTDPRHKGFVGYLRDNIVLLAVFAGLLCTVGITPLTTFLSRQTYECPSWAANCQVYTQKIGTIQGSVTLVYTIGLLCLAYACWALAEASLWPLLCRQPFTLTQIDRYLAVTRGSIPSIPLIFGAIKSWDTVSIVFCAVLATITSLSAGPVVGYVFDQPSLPTIYQGQIAVGGGYNGLFTQKNPPETGTPAAAAFYYFYNSNSANIEPMPEHRNWIIDKVGLSTHGNFSAHAVRVAKNITCDGFRLSQTNGSNSRLRRRLYFRTEMANLTGLQRNGAGSSSSSPTAEVWNIRKLSVWAHQAKFFPPNGAFVKMIFAVPGGSMEGGLVTNLDARLTPNTRFNDHTFISAIACDINIELVDDILTIGNRNLSNETLPVISKVSELRSFNQYAKPGDSNYTREELAFQFAVAPIISGISKGGTQPMYEPIGNNARVRGRLIPALGASDSDYAWKKEQVQDLVDGSISAVSQAFATTYRLRKVVMTSVVYAHRMEPIRNVLLAIPVITMLVVWVILAVRTTTLHKQNKLTVMKMAETASLLEAWQQGQRSWPGGDHAQDHMQPESSLTTDVVWVVYRMLDSPNERFGLVKNVPAHVEDMERKEKMVELTAHSQLSNHATSDSDSGQIQCHTTTSKPQESISEPHDSEDVISIAQQKV